MKKHKGSNKPCDSKSQHESIRKTEDKEGRGSTRSYANNSSIYICVVL